MAKYIAAPFRLSQGGPTIGIPFCSPTSAFGFSARGFFRLFIDSPKPIRCFSQCAIGQVRISFCHPRLQMPQKSADHGQGNAPADKTARKGMPQIVNVHSFESGRLGHSGPQLFQIF